MPDDLIVGIQYCGGCNPRYDRVTLVKKLKKMLPEVIFCDATENKKFDAVVIINGCSIACADQTSFNLHPSRVFSMNGWTDLLSTRDRILNLKKKQKGFSLNSVQVQEMLPHRGSMLFIDSVTELNPGKEVNAEFFVSAKRREFSEHFPNDPIFPGTRILESMSQAAGLVLLSLNPNKKGIPLLLEVEDAKFRRFVRPDSLLHVYAMYVEPLRIPSWHRFQCRVLVNGVLVADASIILSLKEQ